jgi:Fic family protein
MAKVLRRAWKSDVAPGVPRRDRASCEYETYIPDVLTGRDFRFLGPVTADVADAQSAVRSLNDSATALEDTEALARLLLRAESVASSQIEGLEVGGRRLLRAEAALGLGEPASDITAEEVLGNIAAMRWAVEHLARDESVTLEALLEVHRRLLAGTRLERSGGAIRGEQNWIGGSSFNPCSAAFVPPPPEHVEDLLRDLCDFCNEDSLPAIAQAAIAHAQFETIHPFVDGNGRTGRALIHVILRRRGLAPRVLPPVSLVLATRADDYIDALTATRYIGPAGSRDDIEGTNRWVELFAASTLLAVADAHMFEERIRDLQRGWRTSLGRVRKDSAVDRLLHVLPGMPILTTRGAADAIGRTFQAANEAIDRLVVAGVVKQVTVGRRNRAFEAPEVLEAFTDLERKLASPRGDTRTSDPSRPVPRRPSSWRD